MKKKMPLILSLVFIVFIGVWSGVIIKAREENIKFTDLYGNRNELQNVQFDLERVKGIRRENVSINKNGVEDKITFNDDILGKDLGENATFDKKFFRGLFPTKETFFEDKYVMVDVSNRLYELKPHFEVRIKNKKDNTYDKFNVNVNLKITENYRINGIAYKDGKINILFLSNYEEQPPFIGEIDVEARSFSISKIIKLEGKNESIRPNLLGGISYICGDKVYFMMNKNNEDSEINDFSLIGFLEVDLNSKSVKVYKVNEDILKEIKEMKEYQYGENGYFKDGKIYIKTQSINGENQSILTFNVDTKKYTFYKNIIQKEKFERYGIDFNGVDKVFIEDGKAYLNLVDYNKKDDFYYEGYLVVVDINSKNLVYIGKYTGGNLKDIKVIGGN